ncbi:unnamed protein product [Orchesella dallaii]|uniref:Palmitoyl-protein thioesterase 1 n=1 Tax=Orchesella dallaii TaxID=48710 RepID=A0ABP1RT36_9HEXA
MIYFTDFKLALLAVSMSSLLELSFSGLVNHNSRKFSFTVNYFEDKPIFENGPRSRLNNSSGPFVPLVYWHGMGDAGVHVKHSLRFIEDQLPGVYVKSIQMGSSIADDVKSGYFRNVNDQVKQVCEEIKNDTNLRNGYNAIGLSQGGQFLRAVAQRCPTPPMINLISLGGQHQGVFGLPKCSAPKQSWCEVIDKLLTHVAYEGWVQNFLVQAEYWHDPFKQEEYVNNSVFLADINNERVKNVAYKNNLQKLRNLVLVLFDDDSIVEPKESEWFGYFRPGSDKEIVRLEDSQLYKEDWLGLKAMNEGGKLHFLSSPGDHLQFTKEWFTKNILSPFLNITS